MIAKHFITQFADKTIAVIGDVMLDRYIYGTVERISPEAPIPIVQWHETQLVPGGAGNTAANITALGANCLLFSVVGEDAVGEELRQTLETFRIDTAGLVADTRPTTEKTRILGNHQQVVRIDHETTRALSEEKTEQLCQAFRRHLPEVQAIIVCDYAKGVISETLMNCVREVAASKKIPVLADVRPDHKAFYQDLTLITPNKKETSGMVNASVRNLDEAKIHGLGLARELKTNLLITMSEDGMLLIEHKTGQMTHLPTKAQEVIDVSGAGDTVIATIALGLASGADMRTAATLANHAASVVVAKLGTATVSTAELLKTF